MNKKIEKLYLKKYQERKSILKTTGYYQSEFDQRLDDSAYDHLIENYLTTYEVPVGVVPNLLIDGAIYHALLATEEPSVIAGCANAASIVGQNGGFKIESVNRVMIGQIIFKNVYHPQELSKYLDQNKAKIIKTANLAHREIVRLGGGLIDFSYESKPHQFFTLYARINCVDAMGANTVNIILEAITGFISNNSNHQVLMSILSNYATETTVKASVIINPATLKNGDETALNISLANDYARVDKYRAVTHNKGIMNGVSALMLATGNDTRAIEAANHAYASRTGTYGPLTKWIILENGFLFGQIKLSLPVGVVGGSMNILPKVRLAHRFMKITSALDLMRLSACVGLASNFAALYALVTKGINHGHLRLHAKSIALEVGCPPQLIDELARYLVESGDISPQNARHFLDHHK